MYRPSGIKPTSSSSTNTCLLITLGDPNGVGPEVAARSVRPYAARHPVVLIGAVASLRPWIKFLKFDLVSISPRTLDGPRLPPGLYVIDVAEKNFRPAPGRMTIPAAKISVHAFQLAVRFLKKNPGRFALVTAPLSKEACLRAGIDFTGHTGYLGRAFGRRPLMLLLADRLGVGLVTEHIPLARVAKQITRSNVLRALQTFSRGLRENRLASSAARPLIRVLGVNPHAGEGGRIGSEDIQIASAVRVFNRQGSGRAVGPLPADSAFEHMPTSGPPHYFLAMYHDQGLIPVKMRGIHRVVNITLGLPARRTSPAHGTAYDIAGRGIADPRSMRLAIDWALRLPVPQGR